MLRFVNYIIIKKKLFLTFPLLIFTFIAPKQYIKKIAYSLNTSLRNDFSVKLGRFQFGRAKKKGVNIIGYAFYDSGYGEHCRNVVRAVERNNIEFDIFNQDYKYSERDYSNDEFKKYIGNRLRYNTNIFTLSPVIANKFFKRNPFTKYDALRLPAGYNIAYGFWEMPNLPKKWVNVISKFDEIWAPTRFVQDAFSKNSITPVIHMPAAIDFKLQQKYSRSSFNLPEDKFLFIFSFDIIGYDNRKNPKAVMDAFRQAFSENNHDVALVLKIVDHGDKFNHIRIENFKNSINLPEHQIYLINESYSKDKVLGLFSVCDCYVSLHRCEGFGMGIAEAMKLGKPAIVTGYSGNLDFNNYENSCLVDYKLVEVKKDAYPLIDDTDVWAEPDINSAAGYMQKVFNDSEFRGRIAAKGKKFIDDKRSEE
ncbi:MAG TPA: hypothetical protein DIV86_03700, partial [Alphaproteobacteria bacterium]|nr:hypothetical protein [Alphaproteobacteria bacterium]